jgi:nucleotide-binding universal stress UspA family protein
MTPNDEQPTTRPSTTVGTIVCGTDGSADAQHAVDYTARLAQQLGAEVVLVHAIGLLEHMPIDAAHPGVTTGDQARELLRSDWSQVLRDLGILHTCHAEEGPPLLALPRIAEQIRADLLIVASHGSGRGSGRSSALPLGSTAHGMIELAAIPVLVVPGDATNH